MVLLGYVMGLDECAGERLAELALAGVDLGEGSVHGVLHLAEELGGCGGDVLAELLGFVVPPESWRVS
ncbi:hypothetical protein [Dietzia maris]|uniref:hypothetical protein n=1 Tax=Dietzia maris TaxID=37915 RepID=UPI001044FC1F